MTFCRHCKAETDASHYRRVVENHTPLYGPWEGWRMAGRDLIAPDRQRISPERLRGLLFRQASEQHLVRAREKCNAANALRGDHTKGCPHRMVVSLPPRERFGGYA